jgi:uncharacterized membrane protein
VESQVESWGLIKYRYGLVLIDSMFVTDKILVRGPMVLALACYYIAAIFLLQLHSHVENTLTFRKPVNIIVQLMPLMFAYHLLSKCWIVIHYSGRHCVLYSTKYQILPWGA